MTHPTEDRLYIEEENRRFAERQRQQAELMPPLNDSLGHLIYDLLVDLGGAHEDERAMFINYICGPVNYGSHNVTGPYDNGWREYRFRGYFGSGGKLHFDSPGRVLVSMYQESETQELKKLQAEINLHLGALFNAVAPWYKRHLTK